MVTQGFVRLKRGLNVVDSLPNAYATTPHRMVLDCGGVFLCAVRTLLEYANFTSQSTNPYNHIWLLVLDRKTPYACL